MSDTVFLVSSALGAVVLTIFLIIYLIKSKKKTVKPKANTHQPPRETTRPAPIKSNNVYSENTGVSDHKPNNLKIQTKSNTYQKKIDEEEKNYGRFLEIFPRFNLNPELIQKYLLEVEYDEIDKGELKTFLERNGISFEDTNKIIDAIKTKYLQKQNVSIILDSLSHYKNLGWDDEDIREHFYKEGYSKNILDDAFKEFYKKNIYTKYIKNIVDHVKPFIRSGKEDSLIIKTFSEHKWPKELVEDAIEKARAELKEEDTTKLLEESILKIILTGSNKECFAKIISKQDWPEDDLKSEFDDLEKAYFEFEKALKNLDLNEYNKEKIKDSLLSKNWPEKLVTKIILNLVKKVNYHLKLIKLEKEIRDKIELGFFSSENTNSLRVKENLISEGWNGIIIKKLIDKINRDLLIKGEKDKVKEFNSHVFKKEKYKDLKNVISGFDVSKISEINDNDKTLLKPSQNSD